MKKRPYPGLPCCLLIVFAAFITSAPSQARATSMGDCAGGKPGAQKRKKAQCPPVSNSRASKKKNQAAGEWTRAHDPLMGTSRRFLARLEIKMSPGDYPPRARSAKLPKVRVLFALMISPKGKIRDIRIISIRSRGNAHLPYCADFIQATRRILLTKTRVLSRPYLVAGKPVPFIWTMTISFTTR